MFCRDRVKVPFDKPGRGLDGEVWCPEEWPRPGLCISEWPAEMVLNSLDRLRLGRGGGDDNTGQGEADGGKRAVCV